jgi:hypothetical protein
MEKDVSPFIIIISLVGGGWAYQHLGGSSRSNKCDPLEMNNFFGIRHVYNQGKLEEFK